MSDPKPVLTITSLTYDASTGTLVISTSGFPEIGGNSFNIHIDKLKFTDEDEEGNVKTHELEKDPDSITVSGADISIVLDDDDREEINELLNDSTYISTDKNWATGSGFTTKEKTIPVTISNNPGSPTGEDDDDGEDENDEDEDENENDEDIPDTTPPTTTFSALAFSADTGATNDFITNTPTQTISATLSATLSAGLGTGDKVWGNLGGNWIDITDKVNNTTLTWNDITLTGSGTLQLKVTDSAGNEGSVLSQAYVLDQAAPNAPGTLATASTVTNDTTPTFTGSGETGATVTLFNDANSNNTVDADETLGTATVAGNAWSITASELAAGSYTIKSIQTDAAGNTSAASSGLTVNIDATASGASGALATTSTGTNDDTLGSGSTNTLPPPSTIDNTSVASGGLFVNTNTTAPGNGSTNTTTTIDGLTTNTIIQSNGTRVTTIPFAENTRSDDPTSLTQRHADIPVLVSSNGKALLTVSIPIGVGLTISGQSKAQSNQESFSDLIQRIEEKTLSSSNAQKEMINHWQGFMSKVAPGEGELVNVQTITPTVNNNQVPQAPIIITGSNNASDPKLALVIDVSNLPSGTILQLNNVAFASIIGSVHAIGGAGENFAVGDDESQFMVLGADDDVLFGGGGDDTVGSLGGDDQTSGDAGDDIVYGGTGNDQLSGGSGNDQLNGGLGFDRATQAGQLADYQVAVQGNAITLTQSNGEVDTLTDVELIRFTTGPSLAIAYSAIEAVAHHLAKTWLGRDLTTVEGSAVQNWAGATTEDILTAFYSLPEAAGFLDKTPDELLAELEENPDIIRLDIVRDVIAGNDNDQGYLPLGLALNADGGDGHDVLRMPGSREDVHLEFVGDSLELTRLNDGAMLSVKNAEAIAFDSGETVVIAHNQTDAILGRLFHSFFNRDATSAEWQLWQLVPVDQLDPEDVLDWFQQNSSLHDLSDTDYIQTIFTQTLGHQASDNQLNFYLNRLENNLIDREELAVAVAESSEAAAHLVGSVMLQEGWV